MVDLLQQCGRFIHHTDADEETLFQILTEEEKTALQGLLGKLSIKWMAQFGEEAFSYGNQHHSHDREHHRRQVIYNEL